VPNPESALNEEAGKLLLESHDEYSERAKMMTEIHAQVIFYFGFFWTKISSVHFTNTILTRLFFSLGRW